MSDKPLFKRNQEGARLYYDVLSSKKTFYYEVEMLGTTAMSCECRAGHYGVECKHRKTAEKAELEFQASQRKLATLNQKTLEDKILATSLNGDRSFSLLKR